MKTWNTRILATRSIPLDPLSRIRNTAEHASAVVAGTSRFDPCRIAPIAISSCVVDLAKKISRRGFQPRIDTYCISAGMIQPRVPNCGLRETSDATPKRLHVGIATEVDSRLAISLPAG